MRKTASLALLTALLAGCSDNCQNSAFHSAVASDGSQKVVLFERNCGATTDFTTQISLVGAGEEVFGKGNVFIAEGGLSAAPWGGPWAEVKWISPKHLRIKYDASARVFEQKERAGDVRISFEKVTR